MNAKGPPWDLTADHMMIVSIGSGNGLVPSRQQAITGTWANVDPVLCRHMHCRMVSLGHNEPVWCQAITWTNDDLSIGPSGTDFSEILIKVKQFLFKEINFKMTSAKWRPVTLCLNVLTYWSWVKHICISTLTIIGSDNGLSPDRCQAIIWTNAGILLIGSLGTNWSEILIEIYTFLLRKMHLKMLSGIWQPFCPCLNVLTLNVQGPSYRSLNRSISWLLMPWLLASPGHQQPWYWPCKIGKSGSYTRKDFNYLWHVSVEEWHEM